MLQVFGGERSSALTELMMVTVVTSCWASPALDSCNHQTSPRLKKVHFLLCKSWNLTWDVSKQQIKSSLRLNRYLSAGRPSELLHTSLSAALCFLLVFKESDLFSSARCRMPEPENTCRHFESTDGTKLLPLCHLWSCRLDLVSRVYRPRQSFWTHQGLVKYHDTALLLSRLTFTPRCASLRVYNTFILLLHETSTIFFSLQSSSLAVFLCFVINISAEAWFVSPAMWAAVISAWTRLFLVCLRPSRLPDPVLWKYCRTSMALMCRRSHS